MLLLMWQFKYVLVMNAYQRLSLINSPLLNAEILLNHLLLDQLVLLRQHVSLLANFFFLLLL